MQYSLTHLLNNYQVLTFPQALMTSLRSAAYGLVRERNVNFFSTSFYLTELSQKIFVYLLFPYLFTHLGMKAKWIGISFSHTFIFHIPLLKSSS